MPPATASLTAKPIKKGDIRGAGEWQDRYHRTDLVKTTYRLARHEEEGHQFITVISGCDVSDEDAEKTTGSGARQVRRND